MGYRKKYIILNQNFFLPKFFQTKLWKKSENFILITRQFFSIAFRSGSAPFVPRLCIFILKMQNSEFAGFDPFYFYIPIFYILFYFIIKQKKNTKTVKPFQRCEFFSSMPFKN